MHLWRRNARLADSEPGALVGQWPVRGGYDAVICLGAVIRGATAHFDYVAGEVAKGIAAVSLDSGVPVIFGVLTTDTTEQAIERAAPGRAYPSADTATAILRSQRISP